MAKDGNKGAAQFLPGQLDLGALRGAAAIAWDAAYAGFLAGRSLWVRTRDSS